MTNDEIKAQAIADVRKAVEAHPINMLAGYKACALGQREQNIRLEMEARWVRDHVHEFGASSNWPVIFSRLSRVLAAQVQAGNGSSENG